MLFSVKVDGERVDSSKFSSEYVFSNIHGPHTIEVVYIWKYTPVCLMVVLLLLLMALFGIRLHVKRKKLKKKWDKRP